MTPTDHTLRGTFWLMIVIQTIGGVDMPDKGPRKLPAPRVYVAATVLWGIFNLLSEMMPNWRKAIAAGASVTVVTALVMGPAGKLIVSWIEAVAKGFAPEQALPNLPGPFLSPTPPTPLPSRQAVPSQVFPPAVSAPTLN